MNIGLGSRLAIRILIPLLALVPLLMAGVQTLVWYNDRAQELALARDDAARIRDEVLRTRAAGAPGANPLLIQRDAVRALVVEAAEFRAANGCHWARDRRLLFLFDARGKPLSDRLDTGAMAYPASSIAGVERRDLAGPADGSVVTLPVRSGDAPCLVDGLAIGTVIPLDGAYLAALHLTVFDWSGYWKLVGYGYLALALFWLLAGGIARQFNRFVDRRIGSICRALQVVEESAFSVQVPVEGGRELELLGRTLNKMIARLGLSHQYFADLDAIVAHNLRSPILIVRRLVENMRGEVDGGHASSLAELERQILLLDQRCKDLLTSARISQLGHHPTDFRLTVNRQIEDIFIYLAQERELDVEMDLSEVMVDAPREVQEIMIDCTMQNAIKFAEPRSTIHVSLEAVDDRAVLTVVNRGPSVAAEQHEVIFERGVTNGGYGLGLYAVRTAARRHGGDAVALPEAGGFRVMAMLPTALLSAPR